VQQTCGSLAEETVEVGRNHEGGTGPSAWKPLAEAWSSDEVGVDASVEMSARRRSESQERRPSSDGQLGRSHALKER
jgi:hypothetical protein